jgi:hypothetical protein
MPPIKSLAMPDDTNMKDPPSVLLLRELREGFLRRAKIEAALLLPYGSDLGKDPNLSAALQCIKEIAHGLSGSGGIFGFDLVSAEAARLEEACLACVEGHEGLEKIKSAIHTLLVEIEAAHMPSAN